LIHDSFSGPAPSPGKPEGGHPDLHHAPAVATNQVAGNIALAANRVFAFEDQAVRVAIGPDGEPMFDISDVARILGYHRNHCNGVFLRNICKGATEMTLATDGSQIISTVIPERDIYRLVLRVNVPKGERFAAWVAGEVLPAIQKTGTDRLHPWFPPAHQGQCLPPLAAALGDGANILVACSGYGLSVHEAAQHLYKGLGVREITARNSFYRWLRGAGYVIPGTCKPFQQWVDAMLFWSISQPFMDADATTNCPKNHLADVALITNKGFTRFEKEFRVEDVPNSDVDYQQAWLYRREINRQNTLS
jgi:hypothetical protein